MKKLIWGFILTVLFTVFMHPVLANSATFTRDAIITGGGIIREGQGKDALKITFGVNVLVKYLVNEEKQPVDEYGNPTTGGQLVFAQPPIGNFHIVFHNTGVNDVNKKIFTATDIKAVAIRPQSHQDSEGETNYIFARIEANGKFNGENGWSILVRFSDFGAPGKVKKENPENRSDAVRIMMFDYPYSAGSEEAVYDTALDYPREESWRTLLDGGNVTIYY